MYEMQSHDYRSMSKRKGLWEFLTPGLAANSDTVEIFLAVEHHNINSNLQTANTEAPAKTLHTCLWYQSMPKILSKPLQAEIWTRTHWGRSTVISMTKVWYPFWVGLALKLVSKCLALGCQIKPRSATIRQLGSTTLSLSLWLTVVSTSSSLQLHISLVSPYGQNFN